MIVVKPIGGLGNRLRVIHSVLSIQLAESVPVKIIWERNRHLNCKFEDLFEADNSFSVSNSWPYMLNRILKKKRIEKIIHSVNLSSYECELYDKKIIKLHNSDYDFLKLSQQNSVYIETCHWFYTHFDGSFLYPEPNKEIKKRVENITRRFTDKTVGVHIRMGDHLLAQRRSPLYLFENYIDNMLKNNSNWMFFLSTDSPDVEKSFKSNYSDFIITQQNKNFGRDSRLSAIHSLVDMLCLSKTAKIYGSADSSFSGIAAHIGGIEKVTLSEKGS